LFYLQESLSEWERGFGEVQAPTPVAGAPGRKWSARAAHVQDTATDHAAPLNNTNDACKLVIVSIHHVFLYLVPIHHDIHFGFTALISRALALISNCKCIA
jgi:hypothetical protein